MVLGGGQLPIEKLKVLPLFDRSKVFNSVRYWDKGGGDDERSAYTAGVLMHKLKNGTYVIEDIVRGRWLALEREERIKATAKPTSRGTSAMRCGSNKNRARAAKS